MTLQRQFVHRYTKIQKGLQERAELALAEAVHAKAEAVEELRQSVETQVTAQEARNQCTSAAELQMWHQYVRALEIKVQASKVNVVDADANVEKQREVVGVAYREAERWNMTSDRYNRLHLDEVRRETQKQADEFASQRARGARE